MGLRAISAKAVYGGSSNYQALHEFLIPALKESVSYERVAGYFSSTVLSVAAQGVAGLLANGGTMKLITSHSLTAKDIEALNNFDFLGDEIVANSILDDFTSAIGDISSTAARMKSDYVKAMCWLLREGRLEIKLVVPGSHSQSRPSPGEFEKFHPKFGVLRDSWGDEIIFAGSVNETLLGWAGNLENLSVYKSWVPELREYCESYKQTFHRYWAGEDLGKWVCIPLPAAIKRGLISVAPEGEFPSLAEWEVHESAPDGKTFRSVRAYQKDALHAWERANRVGLLEMATGTGKTFTARQCIESAGEAGSLLTIVIAPYQHIADQWATELADRLPFQVGSRGNWKDELQGLVFQARLGILENLTITVVKNTAASSYFLRCIEDLAGQFDNYLLVADEVHWLGAPSLRRALDQKANFRLGLSATPDRYFDEEGTGILKAYFGGESVYKFDLKAALEWVQPDGTLGVLAPYIYKPIFVELTEDENEEYTKYSKRIAQISSNEFQSTEDSEEIERLLNLRAEIAKSAANKIPALKLVLTELTSSLKQCLIYCADFAQMGRAMEVSREIGIDSSSRITGIESSSKSDFYLGRSQREHILSNFADGLHAVLFAIDCLDEGVDIPSARIGIIMASSGNPKEFIQRRGRLMRRSPETGKTTATIFDMVVLQGDANLPDSLRRIELKRVAEFAELAINRTEVEALVRDMVEKERQADGQLG